MSSAYAAVLAWFRRVLVFWRLVDPEDQMISLTNLLVIIAAVKLALLKDLTLTELTAFFVSMSAYVWKQHGKRTRVATEDRLKSLESRLEEAHSAAQGAASEVARVGQKVAQAENRAAAKLGLGR